MTMTKKSKDGVIHSGIITVELVEDHNDQTWEGQCPKCKQWMVCDVPSITVTCPSCNTPLVRKDFANKNRFWKG